MHCYSKVVYRRKLMKAKDFQNFMDVYSHKSAYTLQLRKCSLDTCAFCSSHPVCMPLENILSAILPILDASEQHFKPFTEVYMISYQVKNIDYPWGRKE